jgi:DNA gyrase/topoisomerase IV subunit A
LLPVLEAAESADEAEEALQDTFGFTREQALAVLDTQFRRVSRADRTRVSDELAALRTEIAGLESDL